MRHLKHFVPLSLLTLALNAQANTQNADPDPIKADLNRFFMLEVEVELGEAKATEITRAEACGLPDLYQVDDNTGKSMHVVSWIEDDCSTGEIPPNAIYLIQSGKLGK